MAEVPLGPGTPYSARIRVAGGPLSSSSEITMMSSSTGGGLATALPFPFAVVEADRHGGSISGSGEESTYMKEESPILNALSRPAAKVRI